MHHRLYSAAIVLSAVVFSASSLSWANDYRYGPNPDRDLYFGRIAHWDGEQPPVLTRDGQKEFVEPNFPVGPGDEIESPNGTRVEIVFDLGTIIRLESGSRLHIGTILAPSVTTNTKVTTLYLDAGNIGVEFHRYDRSELFQVLTDGGATKIAHKAKVILGVDAEKNTRVQVLEGKAFARFGATQQEEQKVTRDRPFLIDRLGNGERRHRVSNAAPSSFERWIGKRTLSRRRDPIRVEGLSGRSARSASSVRQFIGITSHAHGRWFRHPLLGVVWRPHANDEYPGDTWQPYFHGRWTSIMQERFWVPQEPWGWVPYHFGLWNWDAQHEWIWLPSTSFAPAWVSWDFDGRYASWRPWSLWDWYWYAGGDPFLHRCGYGIPYLWNRCGCRGGSYYDYYANRNRIDNGYQLPNEDQERNPGPGVSPPPPVVVDDGMDEDSGIPPLRRPKELDDRFERAVTAFKTGDKALRQTLRERPDGVIAMEHARILRTAANKEGMRRVGEELVRTTLAERAAAVVREPRLAARRKPGTGESPLERAPIDMRTHRPEPAGDASAAPRSRESRDTLTRFDTPVLRSRYGRDARRSDWNPDSEWARRLDMPFGYDRRQNRVTSPGLREAVSQARRRRLQGRASGGTGSGSSGASVYNGSSYSGNSGISGNSGGSSMSANGGGRSSGTARGKSSGSAGGRGRNNN